MKIVSDHGFPMGQEGNDGTALDAFRNERNYVAQSGRMKATVAAMDWAIAEIGRLQCIIDGKIPKPMDQKTWAVMFFKDRGSHRVGLDIIGDVRISTVFLGLDHQLGEGPPLLFETMIFGGQYDQYTDRCSTWEEAEAMHANAVALVKER